MEMYDRLDDFDEKFELNYYVNDELILDEVAFDTLDELVDRIDRERRYYRNTMNSLDYDKYEEN